MDNEKEAPQVPEARPQRLLDQSNSALRAAPAQKTAAQQPVARKQWPLSTVIITGALAFVIAGVGGVTAGWAIGSATHDRVNFHQRPANGPGPFHPPGQRKGGVPKSSVPPSRSQQP